MNRRNFIKGILGGVTVIALPATADKYIEKIGLIEESEALPMTHGIGIAEELEQILAEEMRQEIM